jgi:uncharacterized protein involved in exopolysaccharide biosynthesis
MKNDLFQYWLELVFRRQAIFLQVAGVVLAVVVIGTLAWPPVYQSTSKILVQDNRAQLLVSPGLQENTSSQPSVVSTPVSEQDLNSEVELITSRFLIEQALSDLPGQAPEPGALHKALAVVSSVIALPASGYDALHQVRPLTPQEQLAIKLADKLSASVIKRSNVIEVAFKSDDAGWSQLFLDHLINRYLELHALVSHDPKAERFFQAQASLLENRLHAAEKALQAMQLQTGINDLSGQKAALVTQLAAFEAESRKTSAQWAATREQISSYEHQLASTPRRLTKESRIVQNLALQQLKPQVLQLQAERAELLTRYRPSSNRIREIDAKLAAAQKILNRENHTEVQESTTDLNPTWVELDSQLATAKGTAASLAADEVALNQQVEAYRNELGSLTRNGLQIERQQRTVDSAKEAYLSYLRKGEEARAAEALNSSKILNVSVAQPPDLPLRPVFPIVPLNLLAGLVAAAGLGALAAYFEEQNDPKLFSVHAIREVSGLSPVATLSDAI